MERKRNSQEMFLSLVSEIDKFFVIESTPKPESDEDAFKYAMMDALIEDVNTREVIYG